MTIQSELPEPLRQLHDAANDCLECADAVVWAGVDAECLPELSAAIESIRAALSGVDAELPTATDWSKSRTYHEWLMMRCQAIESVNDWYSFHSFDDAFGVDKRELGRLLDIEIVEAAKAWTEPQHPNTAKRGNRRRSKKRKSAQTKPLTEKQIQALHEYGLCKGNISEIARRLGICDRAAAERLESAWKKMGGNQEQYLRQRKEKPLSRDKRGQEIVIDKSPGPSENAIANESSSHEKSEGIRG